MINMKKYRVCIKPIDVEAEHKIDAIDKAVRQLLKMKPKQLINSIDEL